MIVIVIAAFGAEIVVAVSAEAIAATATLVSAVAALASASEN